MAHIVTENDEMFARWAARQIPHVGREENFGSYRAIGITTGFEATDRLMAVIVFHAWDKEHRNCQITGAASDPRWASRATLRAVLGIPFYQYNCWKVWTATPHTSERVLRFNKAIGFTREAVLKDQFGKGTHAVICRMLLPDYERFYYREEKEAA